MSDYINVEVFSSRPQHVFHVGDSICRGTDGALYIALVEYGTGADGDLILYKSTDDGESWVGPETVLTNTGSQGFRNPEVICDDTGILRVLFYRGTVRSILEISRSINGDIWSSITEIVASAPSNAEYIFAAGSGVVWGFVQTGASAWNLTQSSVSGSWSTQFSISDVILDPDMAVDASGNAHVVYKTSDTTPFEVRYLNSYDDTERILLEDNGIYSQFQNVSIPRMTISPDDNIHVVYASGGTTGQIAYLNFPISPSGTEPSGNINGPTIVMDATGGSVNTHNPLEVTTDTSNRIYVSIADNTTTDIAIAVAESGSSSFSKSIHTLTDPTKYGYSRGSLSKLWPQVSFGGEDRYLNLPTSGMYLSMVDTLVSHQFVYNINGILAPVVIPQKTSSISGFITGYEPINSSVSGIVTGINFETSSVSGFIHGNDILSSSISGYMFGVSGIDNSSISGFIHGEELISSSISGFIRSAEESFISGYIFGAEQITAGISGFMPTITGTITSNIYAVVSQDKVISSISGYVANSGITGGISGYVFAAEPNQFISGIVKGELTVKEGIAGFVEGIYRVNSSISGFIWGDVVTSAGISGYIEGDEGVNSNISGYIFGVSGIDNSSISGFIRGALSSEINGYIFGISGIENSSISGFIVGDLLVSGGIKAITRGWIPFAVDDDCSF